MSLSNSDCVCFFRLSRISSVLLAIGVPLSDILHVESCILIFDHNIHFPSGQWQDSVQADI